MTEIDGGLILFTLTLTLTTGLAALPPQRVTVGSYFHAELELPKHCKVWEHVSIRLTCINHGSSPAIKSLKFSTTERFRFLTSDGIKMVRVVEIKTTIACS